MAGKKPTKEEDKAEVVTLNMFSSPGNADALKGNVTPKKARPALLVHRDWLQFQHLHLFRAGASFY